MESKLKHLEFIQQVVTRMNSTSFLIKGWTITIVAAIFALAAKDSNSDFLLITYIIIPMFCFLDGYYLSLERRYRLLYDDVRLLNDSQITFDMDSRSYNVGKSTWIYSTFLSVQTIFYIALISSIFFIQSYLNLKINEITT